LARKTKPNAQELPEPPPPLTVETTPQFERDLKREEERGKDLAKLRAVIDRPRRHRSLSRNHRDHTLKGSGTDSESATSAAKATGSWPRFGSPAS
jgi:hypothetical protein